MWFLFHRQWSCLFRGGCCAATQFTFHMFYGLPWLWHWYWLFWQLYFVAQLCSRPIMPPWQFAAQGGTCRPTDEVDDVRFGLSPTLILLDTTLWASTVPLSSSLILLYEGLWVHLADCLAPAKRLSAFDWRGPAQHEACCTGSAC